MSRRLPSRWSRSALAVVAVVAVTLLVTTVAALGAPPPQSVCGPCNDGIVDAGRQYNLPLRVTESNATVRLHPNGSATWVVTSRIAADENPDPNAYPPNATLRDPSALRTNATLRRAIVTEAVRDSRDYLEPDRPDATLRSMEATNTTIRFTFYEPDVARDAAAGVYLVDEYHTRDLGSGWYVDVNTLEIVGPANTTVANDVRSAFGPDIVSIDGNRVILSGDPADPPTAAQDDVYIAFVTPSATAGLRAALAILLATMPTVVATFTSLHLPGLLVLLVALGAIHTLRARRGDGLTGRTLLGWVAIAILAYLVVGFWWYPPTYPHPMVRRLLAAFLIGYALLVAVGSWLLYPRAGRWIGE